MRDQPQTEATTAGAQVLMVGIAPITQMDRFAQQSAAPLAPNCQQKPCDIGLFDLATRDQIDLIDFLKTSPHNPANQRQLQIKE